MLMCFRLSRFVRLLLVLAGIVLSVANAISQNKSDTVTVARPKPYAEVITPKAISDTGLFMVHKVDGKYYFEIPDSMMGREILVVSRISKGAANSHAGYLGYAGDEVGQNIIRFEKGPAQKVFIRTISFSEYAKDSSSSMFQAVSKSNLQPIAMSFDIKAYSKGGAGCVIDITDFISNDNDVLFFDAGIKSALSMGGQQADKSYISYVKSFPLNVEIVAIKTFGRGGYYRYEGSSGSSTTPSTNNITIEVNSSMVLLPKKPMQPRYFDPRVGYFSVGYTDFDANPQGVEAVNVVKRWRLEPKDADKQKYERGELVEPKQPIIFYIDPATPKKWVPYLMQGVNDWQKAFEQAGFKNAIIARMPPSKEENPDWSLEDARYSAIVYKPSDIENASGPSISDPRSGEILESHINWYHNVMKLIHHWYFIQCAPVDTGARKMIFDDELMGQLIRFVSSHEVGHALGLRHNFGSSSTVPVEKLRDKAWVEAHGHTPSIMDYARFNYVAQPEDHIGRSGLFPRIGDYDKWAIEWGYKVFPGNAAAEEEKTRMNNWVMEKMKNKRLFFGSETNEDDPRSQNEQVGDDAMKGGLYGIKNLQRIVPNLTAWTKEANKGYDNLEEMYNEVINQYTLYMNQVAKNIGGIMETPKTVEEEGPVYEMVPKEKQKEAVAFLNSQLFTTPTWLLNEDVFGKTGENAINTIGSIQKKLLLEILSGNTLLKLIDADAKQSNKAYSIAALLQDLKNGIWSELPAHKSIDVYRRNLQKSYVSQLTVLLEGSYGGGDRYDGYASSDETDIVSVVRGQVMELRKQVKAAAPLVSDQLSKFHLQDVLVRLDKALNPKL